MFPRNITVLTILSLFEAFTVQNALGVRIRRSMYYQGPPAPLNHDGTVANTPEVQNAAAAQKAAFAAEFNRLQETDRLAAAHPDFTSPSYNKRDQNQENHFAYNQGQTYSNVPQAYIPAPLNQDGTVALTPEVQQAKAAHEAAFAEEFYRYQAAARSAEAHPDLASPWKSSQYDSNQYGTSPSYGYNPQARIPAPLNHDGTVAQTPEYRAIAAAHRAEYAKAVQNVKYQNSLTQFKPNPSYRNNYW